jgi:ferric uptake regulator, fur family
MSINQILKDKNLKVTKQRKLILEILEKENKPLAAEEIHNKLGKDFYINLSTVYRNLNLLEEKNVLLKSTIDGVSFYQLNNEDHKHFITCNNCHKKFIIENCPVHDLEDIIEKETGFIIKGHNFEFTGICPDCQKKL